METLQNIQNFYFENQIMIIVIVVFVVAAFIIVMIVNNHYQSKIEKSLRRQIASISDRADKSEQLSAIYEIQRNGIQCQYDYVLKVNKGMCLRKEAISKEIIDDLNLRKTAIGEALRVVRDGHFNINAPDVANVVTETADGIYDFLTGKA